MVRGTEDTRQPALKQCPLVLKFEHMKLKQWAAANLSLGYVT